MADEKSSLSCKRQKKAIEENDIAVSSSNITGRSLMWFRADLRCYDNPALYQSFVHSAGRGVVAVYIISEKEWRAHDLAPCKVDFILRHLQTLKEDLWNNLNVPLYIRYGSFLTRKFDVHPADKLPGVADKNGSAPSSTESHLTPQILLQLCREIGANSVFFNKEYEVDEALRDKYVVEYLTNHGISVFSLHDQCIAPPGNILTKEQKPYTVFTPFRSSWYKWIENNSDSLKISPLPGKNSKAISVTSDEVPSLINGFEMDNPIFAKTIRDMWPVGREAAEKHLTEFVSDRIVQYKDKRDFPSTNGTSRLSPYLAIGAVSVRECILAAITPSTSKKPNIKLITAGSQGLVTWISELCWRDFYRHVLFFFPHVCKGKPFKLNSDYIKWRNESEQFQRWCQGNTGFPIVDAGMRQLNATGWMHNRVRMITAMFLTKDLLMDWRLGEAYFMKHLIDGDFASNNGGWQWSASTGTDAQPYFRVFNPVMQSSKNDPSGEYIKRWVPELSSLNAKTIHDPFKTLSSAQFEKLGYPKPMIDHDFARKRAIDAFKAVYAKSKD